MPFAMIFLPPGKDVCAAEIMYKAIAPDSCLCNLVGKFRKRLEVLGSRLRFSLIPEWLINIMYLF